MKKDKIFQLVFTAILISIIILQSFIPFLGNLPLGSMQHEDILKAIELFGCEVAPKVRAYFENK